MSEAKSLVEEYLGWLRNNTLTYAAELPGGYAEIVTPFLNHVRDSISIFAKLKDNGEYLFSDGGATLAELELAGVEINSPRRKEILNSILRRYGVSLSNGELVISSKPSQIGVRKHAILQSILAVEEMLHLSRVNVASIFAEDVEAFLHENDIRFTSDIKFTGKSGYDHHFDFVIPRSRRSPERIVQAMGIPTKDKAKSMLWSWQDTAENRRSDSKLYVIYNDKVSKIDDKALDSLRNYEAHVVAWSNRMSVLEELAA